MAGKVLNQAGSGRSLKEHQSFSWRLTALVADVIGASSQGLSRAWWHQRSSYPSLPGLSQLLSFLLLPSSGVPGPPCSCRILWSRFSSENPQEAVHLSLPHSRPSLSRTTEPGARRAELPGSWESHWERASLQGSTCPSRDTAGLGSSQ